MLIFILNFTNIYSQSNNYVYTWYNESINTLYIDKQLLELSASILSQYLGPLAPIIITNLPYLVSFFSLFFIFRRFLNIIHEDLGHKNTIIAAIISAIATYLFWPFVIPILGIAFIIKIFRIGKSKLQSLKENLSKINPRFASFFSRTTSDIKEFDKDTDKILGDIYKLDKILNHPYIKRLLNSIEKDIKNLNNIISHLLKETENKRLTQHMLNAYLSQFNKIYNDAKIKIEWLTRTINTMLSNISLLRRVGNKIFRTNKFTPKYLSELKNIRDDLIRRLNIAYREGLKVFNDLNALLTSSETISRKYETEISNISNILRRNKAFLYLGKNKVLIRKLQKIATLRKSQNISPLKKLEIISKINKDTKKSSKLLEKVRINSIKLPKIK